MLAGDGFGAVSRQVLDKLKPNFDTFVLDWSAPAEQPTDFVEHYFLAPVLRCYCGAKLV